MCVLCSAPPFTHVRDTRALNCPVPSGRPRDPHKDTSWLALPDDDEVGGWVVNGGCPEPETILVCRKTIYRLRNSNNSLPNGLEKDKHD